ncbi:hypothetical protein LWC34_39660 [Kibdelosporangium philippinense]|uniref:Uncharacterized protein n=1 Tax=Kibdelosporangium philippinense TaxID=211113 RepID=A0ABS8ZM65_9PSEU|nr:hypothetical protein [Kibdelosporangium philippinense]
MSRLIANKPAKGTLFANPGEPGAPAQTFPLYFAHTTMVESQDIYAIDPRGTTRSATVSCGDLPDTSTLDPRDPGRVTGNTCVADVVDKFVVDGTFPRSDIACPGVPFPMPTHQVPSGRDRPTE